MNQSEYLISPEPLSFETIEEILENDSFLRISDASKALIEKSKAYLDDKIARTEGPLYGITTGFGALCDIDIPKADLSKLQENLVLSHACNLGPEIPHDVTRLMLLLKAHALAKGNSAVQLITVQRILDMFNHRITPVVCELGSLGASGDLAPLSMLFLPLLGHGEVWVQGGQISGC